jgi:hypothetical protein
LFLTAETTEGVVFHGEAISKPKGDKGDPLIPEDIGQMAAAQLLDEISRVERFPFACTILCVYFRAAV